MILREPRVVLKGDERRAQSLALAHVERLLLDFRRGRSFQSLQIVSREHNFLSPEGALIGNIRLTYAAGEETVIVTAPPPRPTRRELIIKKLSDGAQFVPVLRSTDSQHFVACLSGTFDGPYYLFRNTSGTEASEFSASNESELDGKLIAQGDSPLGDSPSPQLIFVAQTGTPYDLSDVEYDDSEAPPDDEVKPIGRYTGEEWANTDEVLSYEPLCCSSIGRGTMLVDIDFERNYGYSEYPAVEGVRINIPPTSFTISSHTWGTLGRSKWFQGAYTCEQLRDTIESYWLNGPYSVFGVGYDLGANYEHADSSVSVGGELAVISMDSTSQAAALYQVVTIDTALEYEVVSGECEEGTKTTTLEKQEWDTKNCFKVDGEEFSLPAYTAGALRYPAYSSDTDWIKYYGSGSLAAVTGMFGSVEFYPEPGVPFGEFVYGYCGPNNGNALTLTSFERASVGGTSKHNVPGVDDEILFYGDFFLGFILTSSEEEFRVF